MSVLYKIVKITPNFSFARWNDKDNDFSLFLSVWKQRNAALVRMVPEIRKESERERKRSFGPSSPAARQDFASSPAEAASMFNLPTPSQATFSITLQWVQTKEMTEAVAIVETGALTDHAITEEDP
jgi:hypothetical protein